MEPTGTDVVAAAKAELWRRGVLRWLLHPDQQAVYDDMMGRDSSREVMEIARKWGKTWLLLVIAFETCIRNPGCRVVYGAPTLKHLEEFVHPVATELIEQFCPPDVRPKWNEKRGHYEFPKNGPARGSFIHLFGAENKLMANRGRGPKAKAAIFDEAGFCEVLRYVLRSIFRPSLLHGNGRTFLGSTPAETPDHDFTEVAEIAERNGTYARRTVWDNPLLTEEQIAKFVAQDAYDEGMSVEDYQASDDFRREYLAERVVNKLLVVLPEWAEKRERLIRAMVRPEFYDGMTVLDPGGNDPHALSFGYWDFQQAVYVQEDELLLKGGENTDDLVALAKRKEKELWGVELYDGTMRAAVEDEEGAISASVPEWMQEVLSKAARPQPYARWMDINVAMARDLYMLHKMAFLPTAKNELQVQVNNLRVAVRREEYVVHPRCVHTDRHLRDTTWKDGKRREFARKAGEHGDLLATAVYTMRNVNRQHNPYPKGWVPPDLHSNPLKAAQEAERQREVARAIFGDSRLARRLAGGRR